MGNPFGPPNMADVQRDLLRTALQTVEQITVPGQIVDYDGEWPRDFADKVTASLLNM